MLMNMNQMLAVAKKNNFAVGAFNISDYAHFLGVMRACEELNAPVIIEIHPHPLDLPDLSGTASTPLGRVQFDYRRADRGVWQYHIELPEGAEGLFISPSGKRLSFRDTLQFSE